MPSVAGTPPTAGPMAVVEKVYDLVGRAARDEGRAIERRERMEVLQCMPSSVTVSYFAYAAAHYV